MKNREHKRDFSESAFKIKEAQMATLEAMIAAFDA